MDISEVESTLFIDGLYIGGKGRSQNLLPGAPRCLSVKHAALDLGIMTSSLTLGIDPTLKRKKKRNDSQICGLCN